MTSVYVPDTDVGVSQDTVDRAVRKYVSAGSGLSDTLVIPGNSEGPAPSVAYASVLLVSSLREGRAWTRYDDIGSTIIARTIASYRLLYQVQFYRRGAHELAARFRAWTESPGGIIYAQQRGLFYSSCGEVLQLDSVISAEWEERAVVELIIAHYRTLEQDAGIIEAIPIQVNDGPQEVVR